MNCICQCGFAEFFLFRDIFRIFNSHKKNTMTDTHTPDHVLEAVELSVSLFKSISLLEGAEAQLQDALSDAAPLGTETKRVVKSLLYAKHVAHAACEAALTRAEQMYTQDTRGTEEHEGCKEMAASVMLQASTVSSAIEYVSAQCANWSVSASPPSLEELCGDDEMRAAIDSGSVGALAIGVVLLSESSTLPLLRGTNFLFYALEGRSEPQTTILDILLHSPVFKASVTDRDNKQYTPLMIAAMRGYTTTVVALLACPEVASSANAVNLVGETALVIAMYYASALSALNEHGHIQTIIAMLACPAVAAVADAMNVHGNSALMFASYCGFSEVVTALLACPAVASSVGNCNLDGKTALMLASDQGHATIVSAIRVHSSVSPVGTA
jgi:hypothetical protein